MPIKIKPTGKSKYDMARNEKVFEVEVIKEKQIPGNIKEILLRPNLFNEITEIELDKKIVGEVDSRKVIFLAAQGRLVMNHQTASYNLLVNDDAGTGKDYITGATLEIIPSEVYIHKTRISPAVFTYWHNPQYEPDWTWDGKVFYPEDISEMVLNSDVFKVMTSKGSSATIVIKQRAVEIDIKGKPVMIATTATATPNPELTRRFVMLNLDSSEDQTKAIMKRHSLYKTNGIVPEYNPDIIEAQKHLQRVKVKIPFAEIIDQHFPSKNIIMRTHYPRFLDFISAAAAFHQYQRPIDTSGYVLANGQDYDLARACFLKLCSNKYMIPLTINQKRILEVFEKEPGKAASASNLHSTNMNFMALKNLQDNLQALTKYGILTTELDKDAWNRDIELYSLAKSYKPNEKIDIPTYEKLMQFQVSKVNVVSKVSKVSTVNTSEEEEVGTYGTYGIYPKNCNNNELKSLEELEKQAGVA